MVDLLLNLAFLSLSALIDIKLYNAVDIQPVSYTHLDVYKRQTENTTVVVAESTPIIQYVYSPVHVPYYPPHHYGVYLPYFLAFTCVAVHAYRYNHYYYHSAYQRGYYHGGNTV